jgi:nitroreductase
MEFFEALTTRYSVRGYTDEAVPDDALEQVLEAGRRAPTAANRQPFRIIVAHTRGREEELARVYGRGWFTQAPLVLAVVALDAEAWHRAADGKSSADVDAAIVMDHLILAAAALGLGTCWIAAFDPVATREVFGLPDDVEPIVLTPLGYPAKPSANTGRRPLSELVMFERWQA